MSVCSLLCIHHGRKRDGQPTSLFWLETMRVGHSNVSFVFFTENKGIEPRDYNANFLFAVVSAFDVLLNQTISSFFETAEDGGCVNRY